MQKSTEYEVNKDQFLFGKSKYGKTYALPIKSK